MTASASPLHIGRVDLVVVNGIGPGIKPQLHFADSLNIFERTVARTLFNGTNVLADATLLAEIHACLLRIEGQLR